MNKDIAQGYLSAAAAAVLWASSGSVAKAVMRQGLTPQDLVQARLTIASLCLAIALAVVDRKFLRIRIKDLGYFVVLGLVVMALKDFTRFYAISQIPVSEAILLQYTSVIMVAAYALLRGREQATPQLLLSVALAVLGGYFGVGAYHEHLLTIKGKGIIAGLVSAASFATYALVSEKLVQRYSAWTVVFYSVVLAAISWNIVHRPLGVIAAGYTLVQWGALVYVALAGVVVAFALFTIAVKKIRSTRATITSTVEPISATIIGCFLLEECLELWQGIGIGMVIVAIVLSRNR
jgi:drug/metabolite transporter (DMT)-like permease